MGRIMGISRLSSASVWRHNAATPRSETLPVAGVLSVRYRTEQCIAKVDDMQRLTVPKGPLMHLTLSLTPLVSLLAGILILVVPRLLNYIVATYLIVVGILGLVGDIHLR
jgi:hypothetical protein